MEYAQFSKLKWVLDIPRRKASGRPLVTAAKKRTVRLVTYVTPLESKRIRKRLRRGQTISDALRDAVLGTDPAARPPAVEALPPPAPREVAATTPTPAAVARESERATAPQASTPAAPMAAQGGARMPGGPLIPAPVAAPPEQATPPPQKRPRADLVAEAIDALESFRGTGFWVPAIHRMAARDPQLVLDVVREAQAAELSHRELRFRFKERTGE